MSALISQEESQEQFIARVQRAHVMESLAAYPRLAEFARRMERGCRRCGVLNRGDGPAIQGVYVVPGESFAPGDSYHYSWANQEWFGLCFECCDEFVEEILSIPHYSDRFRDEWYEKKIKRLEMEVERQKELRRKRDAKPERKAARKAKREQNDPWIKLAKLDILAEEGSTESERENARQKASELRGRLMANAA